MILQSNATSLSLQIIHDAKEYKLYLQNESDYVLTVAHPNATFYFAISNAQ